MLKNGILDVFLRLFIVALITITFTNVVQMEPTIDRFFFFASDDPASVEAGKIDKLFSEQNQIVISADTDNIYNPSYYWNVKKLGDDLIKVKGVKDLKSLAHGPKNFQDAMASPLWQDFLFGKSKNSSLVIIRLEEGVDEKLVLPEIEKVAHSNIKTNFDVQISGMPFMVQKIREHLLDDMRIFSTSAIVIFGLLLFIIFGSFRVLLGTMVTCFVAIMATLIAMTYSKVSLGILTANISTIVFIITQSHIIFLTSNWKRIGSETAQKGRELAISAMKRTFNPSFWCMVTTLLGFLSLIFVPAKPLKDLGLGGAIGTFISIIAAYLIYPSFLSWVNEPKKKEEGSSSKYSALDFLAKHKYRFTSGLIILAVVIVGNGIYKLDLDPGIHEYFGEGTEIRRGLEDIDRSGGSSILSFVISNKNGKNLANKDSYKRMWRLKRDLQAYPAVGTTISLAHLLAESDRHPLSFIFSIKARLDLLCGDKFERVGRDFITSDYKQAHFLMRIIESDNDYDRRAVIEDLKAIADRDGFNVDLVGGVYFLQEELASLIKASLIKGIAMLLFLFLIIAYIVSRSVLMSLSMVLGVGLIPLIMLGMVGNLSMPLDIFATPAVNVCIGIAVDTMIHLAIAVKLHSGKAKVKWEDWVSARKEQFRAIITSTSIVAAGFSIFLLSYFPPTFRFGFQVVIGTVLAAFIALMIFPALGSASAKDSSD